MGFVCAVLGCKHKSGRDKAYKFYSLPKIVKHQGIAHEELTSRRQRLWLASIKRSDIKNLIYIRVCSDHFVSGKPAYEYWEDDVDWVPTLKLGHSKITKSAGSSLLKKPSRLKRKLEEATAINPAGGCNSDPGDEMQVTDMDLEDVHLCDMSNTPSQKQTARRRGKRKPKGEKKSEKEKTIAAKKRKRCNDTEQESLMIQQNNPEMIKAASDDPYPVSLITRLPEGIVQLPIKPDPDATSPNTSAQPTDVSPKPDPDDPCMNSTSVGDYDTVKEEPVNASAVDTSHIDTTGTTWLEDQEDAPRSDVHQYDGQSQSPTREIPELIFTCDICYKTFAKERTLRGHKELAHVVKPHKCTECNKIYTSAAALENHLRIGHSIYVCHHCGEKFREAGQYNEHVREHRPQKTLVCRDCDLAFRTPQELLAHIPIHSSLPLNTDSKPKSRQLIPGKLRCKECGEKFTEKSELEYHLSEHANTKVDICLLCEQTFIHGTLHECTFKAKKSKQSNKDRSVPSKKSESSSKSSLSSLFPHESKCPSDKTIQADNLKLRCFCQAEFNDVHKLQEHFAKDHTGQCMQSSQVKQENTQNPLETCVLTTDAKILIPGTFGQTAAQHKSSSDTTKQKDKASSKSSLSLFPQASKSPSDKTIQADNLKLRCFCQAEFTDISKLQEHFTKDHTKQLMQSLQMKQANKQNPLETCVLTGKPITQCTHSNSNKNLIILSRETSTGGKVIINPVPTPVGNIPSLGNASNSALNQSKSGKCELKKDASDRSNRSSNPVYRYVFGDQLLMPTPADPTCSSTKELQPVSSVLSLMQDVSGLNSMDTQKSSTAATNSTGQINLSLGQNLTNIIILQNVASAPQVHSSDSSGAKTINIANTYFNAVTKSTSHQSSSIASELIKTCGRESCMCCKPDEPEVKRTYVCSICDKVFKKYTYLTSHMRSHTGKRDYQCDICGKQFLNKYYGKIHLMTHTGEKPHQCDICGKSFLTPANLKKHMQIHTGDKSFECTFCENKYSDRRELKRHQKNAHEDEMPFLCQQCGERFVLSSELEEHDRKYHGDQSFKCHLCDKRFGKESSLHQHHSRVHS